MIKNTATEKISATLSVSAEDIAKVAEYLTLAGDTVGRNLEARRNSLTENLAGCAERIEQRQSDIENYRESIADSEKEIATIAERIANLPTRKAITEAEVQSDLARVVALPFVKSVQSEVMEGKTYLVITTREGVLYTTLARKFSRSERWYRAKPYKIALPQYRIRVGTQVHTTHALNDNALAIALANSSDSEHFLEWINRYSHEPHPHWGTTSIPRSRTEEYRAVCLGEFESEVSGAFRTSIADGLIQFATYLQSAGAEHSYISTREMWALWLGKEGYNALIVPSEKEKLGEEISEDNSERSCSDGDCDSCEYDECECDCHN